MSQSKIKFTQEGPKSISNQKEIEIKWIVRNDSEELLENVNVISQIASYSFGDITPHCRCETVIAIKILSIEDLKQDFGENAQLPDSFIVGASKLYYVVNGKSFEIESNILEIPY